MSGPKYSQALLELARAQQILEQAQIALEKKKRQQLRAEIQRINREISSCPCSSLAEQCSSHLMMLTSAGVDEFTLIEYKAIFKKIAEIKAIDDSGAEDSDELAQKAAEAKSVLQKARNLQNIIAQLDDKYASIFENARLQQKEASFKQTDWTKVSKVNYSIVPQALQQEYELAISAAAEGENPDESLSAIRAIYENEKADNGYKTKELRMRRQAIITACDAKKNGSWYEKQCEFCALCDMLGKAADEIPTTPDTMDTAISTMKEELKQKSMAEYISMALSDSMQELGYSIESSAVLQSKTRTIDKGVYDLSEVSHLNVSSSSDGAVMFEVVGKADTQDKTAVKHDMERFCPDYQKIKEHLKDKGVELTNEKLYPPSEEYVRFESSSADSGSRRAKGTNQKRMQLNNG